MKDTSDDRPGRRFKPDAEFDAAAEGALSPVGQKLRAFVERFERLAEAKQAIADNQKLVMIEAKARGYDVKVLRRIIALRKCNADDVAEEQAVLDLYLAELGMAQ